MAAHLPLLWLAKGALARPARAQARWHTRGARWRPGAERRLARMWYGR
jgi:hypothetical protein